jgi:hypothetical protein
MALEEFGEEIKTGGDFLNCMWIYDTHILETCPKEELVAGMNKYPCCKLNEMTLMALYFIYKYKLWKPMPLTSSAGKYLLTGRI